jgi:hypothetical protein
LNRDSEKSAECTSSDECPSEPSENVTQQCITFLQQTNRNNKTNITNASSVNGVGNASQIQTETRQLDWATGREEF